ncbi:MAG TPA: ATP-dependent sacrificial sulfur transferase LarE [Desulfobacteraceae bacterium]|nr:ATP-dependent sacrificial sulfur transferase LarE [Desulfobacteraceae bacterium]
MKLHDKQKNAGRILDQYGKVAIAFSGGADSSLLLKLALDILGPDRVLVLTARSCLVKPADTRRAADWFIRHAVSPTPVHEFVDLQPLLWDDFVRNPEHRCYLCKSRIYTIFCEITRGRGFAVLADGTNADDMNSARPGLRAIRELGIETPLAAAGLTKDEVRELSRQLGLETWNQPSASCLATRLPTGLPVTADRLERVAGMEKYLDDAGFSGCRVRLDKHDAARVLIQVQRKDLPRIAASPQRDYLIDFLNNMHITSVALDLRGR